MPECVPSAASLVAPPRAVPCLRRICGVSLVVSNVFY